MIWTTSLSDEYYYNPSSPEEESETQGGSVPILPLHGYLMRKQQNPMLDRYDTISNKRQMTFVICCDLELPV